LVFDGSEEKDVHLLEIWHATSAGSNGESPREDHHYEGDESAHCDDGGDLGDDAVFRNDAGFHDDAECRGELGLYGAHYAYYCKYAVEHAAEHAAEHVLGF
jgi:hypothetical protein